MCAKNLILAYSIYTDAECKTLTQAEPPVAGYVPDYCTQYNADTWVKAHDVMTTGNKYGIGWSEGITIFACQTMMFGFCDGFE